MAGDGARPQLSAAEFLGAVEERFRRLRGRPLVLSPKDTRLALSWHEDRVPLDIALEVISDLFARAAEAGRRGPRSLAYCDEAVRNAAKDRAESQAGARRGAAAGRSRDDDARRAAYESAARAVRASRAPAAARDAAAARLERLSTGVAGAGVADPLLGIEEALVAACLDALDDGARRELTESARAEIAPWSAAMSEDVRARAWRRAEARAVRARFGIPDLSCLPLPPAGIADPGDA